MDRQLTILCVTRCQDYSQPFLDSFQKLADSLGAEYVTLIDSPEQPFPGSLGYIESILDKAISFCNGRYILRLDDDELPSPAMVEWLQNEDYLAHDHWCFPRMHMIQSRELVIMHPALFPDHQTRLSVKAKSGGRHTLHAMSPFGMGVVAPVAIEHHKFLVRTRAEREETSRLWHSDGMKVFSLPEDVLTRMEVVSRGTGVVPWVPEGRYVVEWE